MRICYISSARIPTEWAHVLQILHMCEAYALEGHEVTLLCPRWVDPRVGADAYAFGKVRRNFRIVRLPRVDVRAGSSHHIWYWLRTISFLVMARLYLWFDRYDLIMTRDYAALFLFRHCLYEIHTPPKVEMSREHLIGRALGLAVLTSGIRDFYVSRGVPANHIHIAPDAVDPERFDSNIDRATARASFGIPADRYVVGYVGTLKAVGFEKGIDTVIAAAKELPRDLSIVIFGGEDDHVREYQALAKKSGVSDRVRFFGQIAHEEVPLAMRSLDCALVPLPDVEVFRLYTSPLKVFEYMAAGVPMIVSDLPSLRDVLDERTAHFVPPSDAHALAAAIGDMRNDPVSAVEQAARAKRLVRERYTWRARARQIIAFARRRSNR